MPKPPSLTILPEPELSPADKVLSRVKKQARQVGMLQCPRCGSRNVLQIRNGVVLKPAKVPMRGTVIVKDACACCWKLGAVVKMVPGGQGPKLAR